VTTLQELRDQVRVHMDLDASELPNGVLDTFAREASNRIEAAHKRWPFRRVVWSLGTIPEQSDYSIVGDIGPDVRQIQAVSGGWGPLFVMGRDDADAVWPRDRVSTSHRPMAWSVWGDVLRLYPTPAEAAVLEVRGYDTVLDWVSGGAGATPDFPQAFHNTVFLWMLARAYAQQEDDQFSVFYLDLYNDELARLGQQWNESSPSTPIVIGSKPSGHRSLGNRLAFPWE
jgi:hypothetical protein